MTTRQFRFLFIDCELILSLDSINRFIISHYKAIQIVKDFQSFSDQVEVIILPRNTKWITNTPEGKARLADVIKQIEQATGITIRDHQDLDIIEPTMFSDTTRLARYRGDVPYTNYLVEQYANDL